MAAQPNRYSKSHRLGGKLQFSAVFEAKVRESLGCLTLYAKPNDCGHWRLGMSVSRQVGTAPRRNRIKRLLREAFRLMQHELPAAYDLVIVVRPHKPLPLVDYQGILAVTSQKLHARWQG